jgi:hypothetical protein
LKLVANSEQVMTRRLRRRLVTMEKVAAYDPAIHNLPVRIPPLF